uniref:Nucleoporin Nup37 n=1 Tax=Timema douglasi TaxID=61478 RepID=A0A7R8VF11_TIMDO|nr:unnamed protein product [Timema douglasi]
MDTICNVMALTTEALLLALSKKVHGDREHNIVCNFKGAEATQVWKQRKQGIFHRVFQLLFWEDDEELDDDPEYLELEKFSQKHRTLALAWSPETSLNVFPKTVAFCSAASDHKLRLYNSDLAANSTLQELRGHTDYINAVAYDPYGEYVVSTSDDHTCRVWSLKELPGQCITNIRLLSPGMSVACHQSEEGKLLVGEKCGVLSLFNLVSGQAILSFDSNRSPLFHPLETCSAHVEGSECVRFSPLNHSYIATIGQPKHQLKITHLASPHPILVTNLQLTGGLTWHYRLPYVCVGNDRKLCMWKISTK